VAIVTSFSPPQNGARRNSIGNNGKWRDTALDATEIAAASRFIREEGTTLLKPYRRINHCTAYWAKINLM